MLSGPQKVLLMQPRCDNPQHLWVREYTYEWLVSHVLVYRTNLEETHVEREHSIDLGCQTIQVSFYVHLHLCTLNRTSRGKHKPMALRGPQALHQQMGVYD